jgi:hypothetical protein
MLDMGQSNIVFKSLQKDMNITLKDILKGLLFCLKTSLIIFIIN